MFIAKIYNEETKSIALLGGKGASLVKLSRLESANVPEGFIITTAFWDKYVLPEIEHINADKKSAIAGMALPDEARKMIASAYSDLCAGGAGGGGSGGGNLHDNGSGGGNLHDSGSGGEVLVAVRSSATAEDLPDASFAGQQDSFLNVSGPESVIKAVIGCFASLYNERAVSYRAKNMFDENQVHMAVVVQKMVRAKAAGVMFTADPTTSDRLTVAIEAVEGLGEELVSGRINPATYNIKGGAIKKISGEDILTEPQIRRLVAVGKEIEQYYGCPQDVEWALEGDSFHIVQSRAVTTLYPCPPSRDGFKRCFISIGHIQMMTDTILPLGMSFWKLISDDVDFVNAGGRMYLEVTHNMTGVIGKLVLKQKTAQSDELMDGALNQVLARKDYIKSIPKGKASNFAMPKTLLPALFAGWGMYRKNDPASIETYRRRMDEAVVKAENALSKLAGRDAVEFMRGDMEDMMKCLTDPVGMGTLLFAYYLTNNIDKAGKELLGRETISAAVSKSLTVNITSEMGVSVSRIADAARDFPEVVKYFEASGDGFDIDELKKIPGSGAAVNELVTFFTGYGMRCPGEIDISKPRFIEEPSKILSSVLADIKLPKNHATQKFEQGRLESDSAVEALVGAAKTKWGPRKAKKLAKKLSFYRNFLGFREFPKYYWMKRYWVYKQALKKEAENLVGAGKLRNIEDIYYLKLDELLGLYDGSFAPDHGKLDALRSDYGRWAALTPPRLIFSDGEIVTGEYKKDIPAGALPGLAVSNGVAEGRARVILDVKDAHRIEMGDILVTKYTDPSWTPAFMSIGALITEIGGMATHGAVITREYGLPAVVGVINATKQIKDGDIVRVNGDMGYIELLDVL